MANAKSSPRRRRGRGGLIILALLAMAAAAAWFSAWGERLRGDAAAGSAYAARVGCSCRFVAGRSLEDCRKDKLTGMAMVSLSDDEETKSVTASVPLLASETARLRKGYGCMLDTWPRAVE